MATVNRVRRKKGFSTLEYLVMLMILAGALFVFKDYLLRAMSGRWKDTSDQFGLGRQFDPVDSVECSFDSVFTNRWYDVTCFENKNCVPGNRGCEELAISQCHNDFCESKPGDQDYVAP